MYFYRPLILAAALCAALTGLSHASQFDSYGSASPELVAIQPTSNFVFVLGMGIGTAPAYEGASEYGATFTPIIKVERLLIPGLIDIGGQGDTRGGFKFSPSFGVVGERNSDDYEPLQGLDDIDATYALGARVGYEVVLNETMSAEIYGAARYAFGGAEGLVGEAGVDVTARLTPQLEIIGGPVVNFATSSYMDTYFGVTSAESAVTGGRLDAFDPSGGIKSVGVNLAARYEFMPDTFVNLNGSYTTYVGDARQSPIVQSGSQHQFTATLGLSRRFAF